MQKIKQWRTSNQTEILGGLTTFFTMAYIVIINPQIMANVSTGIPLSAALTSTVMLCFLMTFFAGFFAKLPYAVGPGMGINIFVCYSLMQGKHIPWQTCFGLTFLSGLIFFFITLTPIRKTFYHVLPESLKCGFSAGIGLFLAYIGMKNMGAFEADPIHFISLSHFSSPILFAVIGFLICFILFQKGKSYAFLASIFIVTLLSLLTGHITPSPKIFSIPNFSGFFQIDLMGALKFNFISTILTLLLTSIFDSTSTLIALVETGNFKDPQGNPIRFSQSLMVNSSSSMLSGLMGTTPGLIFLESAAGIEMGAKTGLSSIVTALCFLPCLFISPVIGMIPNYATAPILIFVGILMTMAIGRLKSRALQDVIPVFLSIVLMPLSSSITVGVFAGILSYIALKILAGEPRQISRPLFVVGCCCVISILLEYYL